MVLDRRSLLTGLVSFLVAPAIVRVASLDSVMRGVPLGGFSGLYESELIYRMRWITLGYEITREGEAIVENLHGDRPVFDQMVGSLGYELSREREES